MIHQAVLIPGDAIGPEVSAATLRVLQAAEAPVEVHERYAGEATRPNGGQTVLPESTLKAILEHHVALKGPCTTPVGKGFRSVNVGLRKALNLYAAMRPMRSLAGVKTRYENVDLIVVQENTEGL